MEPISCPIRVSTQVNAPHSSRRSPQLSAVPRTHDCPLNVVIPMGGLGRNEFTNAGYPTPKPMIPVVGRPMPRISDSTAVSSRIAIRLPPESTSTTSASAEPTPVWLTAPTMMPATMP